MEAPWAQPLLPSPAGPWSHKAPLLGVGLCPGLGPSALLFPIRPESSSLLPRTGAAGTRSVRGGGESPALREVPDHEGRRGSPWQVPSSKVLPPATARFLPCLGAEQGRQGPEKVSLRSWQPSRHLMGTRQPDGGGRGELLLSTGNFLDHSAPSVLIDLLTHILKCVTCSGLLNRAYCAKQNLFLGARGQSSPGGSSSLSRLHLHGLMC